ncbi:MAG: hypothetical protein M3348_14910 [Acidobacteriota bacterium]|nr:hypothetical protein [Acidobacteriota bacterium]
MNISRRSFLRVGSISALLAGMNLSAARLVFGQSKGETSGRGLAAVPYEAKAEPAFYFTPDTFSQYLNSTFRVSRGKGVAFDATLIAVSDLRVKSQAKAREFKSKVYDGQCFSLTFRAGETDTVSQGTLKFSHAALGRFSLFVVPGASSAEGTNYGAIVNHIV